MKKKTKRFSTALLAAALLSSTSGHLLFPLRGNSPCGFTLKPTAKPQPAEQAPAEMCVTADETIDQQIVLTKYSDKATSVEIPNIVTSIGDTAFDSCSSLTWVTVVAGSVGETYMKENYPNITLNYN